MKKMKKKISKIFTVFFILISFLSINIITPMEKAMSFSANLSGTCQADTYGKGAAGSGANGIDDMVCTVYNLVTGKPGKIAVISLIALGFIRGSGMSGGGGVLSALPPFILGVGLASADSLAGAVGYEIN